MERDSTASHCAAERPTRPRGFVERDRWGPFVHEHYGHRHFATIAATATAVPPHMLTPADVTRYMRKVFDVGERRLDAMMLQWN
jgi:hypothetical protein